MARLFLLIAILAGFAAPVAAKTDLETEYATEIAEAERLGRIIHDYDIAAWVATDLLVERVGDLRGKVTGWIVEDEGKGERVLFYRGSNGLFMPAYSMTVENGKASDVSFKAYAENDALTPTQTAMIKARERGLATGVSGCSKSYNTVVIPDEAIGYLVYVLAATTDPTTVQIGGHLRHDVDASGENVVGFRKFTNSCLALPKPSAGGGQQVVAMMVSQILTPYPTEIHIWANLLHDIDLFVITGEKTMWRVSNGRINDESSLLARARQNVSFTPPASVWSILNTDEYGHPLDGDFFTDPAN